MVFLVTVSMAVVVLSSCLFNRVMSMTIIIRTSIGVCMGLGKRLMVKRSSASSLGVSIGTSVSISNGVCVGIDTSR